MRVAIVCPYAFEVPGGVQDQVRRLVHWLRDAGHSAWAVAPGSGGPEGTRHLGRFRSVPANRSRAPISLDPRVGRKVEVAVEGADVVHIHEPFMPFAGVGALRAVTPPKVGTFHADPGRLATVAYRWGAPVLRRWAGGLGAVTAVSEVAASAVRHLCDPVVVPNGIDLEPFADRHRRVPGRVLFVGRDDPRKGLDILLAAWGAVRAQVHEASLHVVGAQRPAPPPGVTFLGRVDEDRKVAELLAAEVFVAPNLGGESFGINVLEGMAAGCAVVASDLDGFVRVTGGAARLVPVGDAAATAEAVTALLGSDADRRSLSHAGRERSARFGRDVVLEGYLGAYERALAGP